MIAVLVLMVACGKGGDDKVSNDDSERNRNVSISDLKAAEAAQQKDDPPATGGVTDHPRSAWDAFAKAVADGDVDGVWSVLSDASMDEVLNGSMSTFLQTIPTMPDEQLEPLAKAAGVTAAEMRAMPPTDLAKYLMLAEAVKNKHEIVDAEWKGAAVTGDQAVITTSSEVGEKKWAFVKQSDGWRMDGPGTAKLENRPPPPVPPPAP